MKVLRTLVIHTGLALQVFWLGMAAAQAQDPGQLQRLLTPQTQPTMPVLSATAPPNAAPAALPEIRRLDDVQISPQRFEPLLRQEWAALLGAPLGPDVVEELWLRTLGRLRAEGYLADLGLQVQTNAAGGQVLHLQVRVPALRRVSVLASDSQERQALGELVRQRVLPHLRIGQMLNMHALDQRLEVVSHDLPIELEAVLRAAGAASVDLEIHVSDKVRRSRPHAWLEANNHGVEVYGRAQLLGHLSLPLQQGHTQTQLTALASRGVAYLRAEHEALAPWLHGRWLVWGSHVRSRMDDTGVTATLANASELALGARHLLAQWGEYLLQSRLEWVSRQARSDLQQGGLPVSQVRESHGRLRLSLDNDRIRSDASRLEALLVTGRAIEALGSAATPGRFARLELQGRTQGRLDLAGRWLWRVQARGQWASQALDGYHQINLGSVQGVRAYPSAEGSGDQGVLASLDLRHVLGQGQVLGVFVDAGRAQSFARGSASGDSFTTLGAIGLSWQAQVGSAQLNISVARGISGAGCLAPAVSGKDPCPVRLNLGLGYGF